MKKKERGLIMIDTIDWKAQLRGNVGRPIEIILTTLLIQNYLQIPKDSGDLSRARNVNLSAYLPLKDSESKNKANILNRQFSSVFTSNEDIKTIPDKGQSTHPRMDNIQVTQNVVLKLLSNLNILKVAVPNEIPTRLLKELTPYLAETLTTFFQASINQGTIAPDWKEAFVIPIFKKGNKILCLQLSPSFIDCRHMQDIRAYNLQ